MLPDDSILRHLPNSLELQTRLKLEALVYASDILALACDRMRQIALHYFGNTERITHRDRVGMFQDAWSSVDQVHTAIQVIKALGLSGPNQRAFCESFACSRNMRNGMDHLVQNVSNLAKRQGFNPPIYGALSYYEISSGQIARQGNAKVLVGVDVVSISAGYAGPGGVALSSFEMAGPFEPPVCHFVLWAFDWKLCIDKANHDLNAILDHISGTAREHITKQAHSEAERTGAKLSDILAEPPLARVAMRVSLSTTAQP